MFTFKTKQVEIGENSYGLRELSVKQQKDIFEQFKADEDSTLLQARYVKAGCYDCHNMSIDEILDCPASIIKELADEIAVLSGLVDSDEKN